LIIEKVPRNLTSSKEFKFGNLGSGKGKKTIGGDREMRGKEEEKRLEREREQRLP